MKYVIKKISGADVYFVTNDPTQRMRSETSTAADLFHARWVGKNYQLARFWKWWYNIMGE